MSHAQARAIRAALAVLGLALAGCSPSEPEPYVDPREPCADQNPLRNVYWGDLHVHTSYSFDAAMSSVTTTPVDAYRFAQGEPIDVPPGDSLTLRRPLDFAAVTEHAEFLGEIEACFSEGSGAFESQLCQDVRVGDQDTLAAFGIQLGDNSPERFESICGSDLADCPTLAGDVWQRIQQAAEGAYDRSEACSFTTFVAYEWSGVDTLSNLHRNVVFRNDRVPSVPVSHFEEPTTEGLWHALEDGCLDGGPNGCDVITIPHNANWSNGKLFAIEEPDGEDREAWFALRARIEPLVEMFQHKGDAECRNGLGAILGEPDEACSFEKIRRADVSDCGTGTGTGGIVKSGCMSSRDFLRGQLIAGLELTAELGFNPLRLGVAAATDTHNSTPGAVAEDTYLGHFGTRENPAMGRLDGAVPADPANNPGGLIAVWAEENTRDALFDGMQRRETYGTSGPRITVRFFGGDLPADLCDRADFVEQGYERGVPMGGELATSEPPRFAVLAQKDPGTADAPGTDLDRIQLIKGWVDDEGSHVEVIDLAGQDDLGSVDEMTCEVSGPGAASLCAVYEDPDFDPEAHAFYYVRVLENPTCRWSQRDCLAIPEANRPDACTIYPTTIQERAWSSPIWL